MTTANTIANPIPATENEAWGFYGGMQDKAEVAWLLAMTAISNATGEPLESVRLFLDSRHGRHFSDDVRNQMLVGKHVEQAIHAAITQWMGWTINRRTSKDSGIPQGLPYLTGFVIHCAITEEALSA
jgi:hypothetical protein